MNIASQRQIGCSQNRLLEVNTPFSNICPWHPHLMFFLPPTEASKWGANLKGAAVYAATGNPEPVTTFFVPVAKRSDGTAEEMK